MSKTLEVGFTLSAKNLPMGGGWTTSYRETNIDQGSESTVSTIAKMGEAETMLAKLGIRDEVQKAMTDIDYSKYEDGESVGSLRVYSDGSWEIQTE